MAKSLAARARRAKRRREENPHRTANQDLAKAMGELRRSSAAQPHDGKSRSSRTRWARNRRAVDESRGL